VESLKSSLMEFSRVWAYNPKLRSRLRTDLANAEKREQIDT
jgi:hypothetical protein